MTNIQPVIAEPAAIPSEQEATGVRYRVLAFLAGMTFVLYLDRVCMGQAAKEIQIELGISNSRMGLIYGAFTVAYCLFEVPTGALADRFGSRKVLTRIVLWWSLFTVLTGAAFYFWTLLVTRFLFGAGEAGGIPNAARVLSRWFPDSSRGSAQGLICTSMAIGGTVAPLAAAAMIGAMGWRWTFVCLGAIGVVWAMAFYAFFRDEPADHPSVNEAERSLIERGRLVPDSEGAHPPIPWAIVLTSPNVWLLGGVLSCAAATFYLIISWYPNYFKEALGATELESGWWTSVALAGGVLGSFSGGYFNDWFARRTGNRTWTRCAVGSISYAVASVCMLASIGSESMAGIAACTSIMMFVLQFQTAAWWATIFQTSGRHTGAMFGLLNSMGFPGTLVSQVAFGWLLDYLAGQGYEGRAKWEIGLFVYVGILLLGSLMWILIRPATSMVERDDHGCADRSVVA